MRQLAGRPQALMYMWRFWLWKTGIARRQRESVPSTSLSHMSVADVENYQSYQVLSNASTAVEDIGMTEAPPVLSNAATAIEDQPADGIPVPFSPDSWEDVANVTPPRSGLAWQSMTESASVSPIHPVPAIPNWGATQYFPLSPDQDFKQESRGSSAPNSGRSG